MSYGNASSSICPFGWKLPAGGADGGQFGTLNTAMASGIAGATATVPNWQYNGPFEGTLSGDYYGRFNGTSGAYGYYWSSTSDGNAQSYYLNFSYTGVRPGNDSANGRKYFGYAIRCVCCRR
jgi:uncharacterized protein (TIGR02145 family)